MSGNSSAGTAAPPPADHNPPASLLTFGPSWARTHPITTALLPANDSPAVSPPPPLLLVVERPRPQPSPEKTSIKGLCRRMNKQQEGEAHDIGGHPTSPFVFRHLYLGKHPIDQSQPFSCERHLALRQLGLLL
jgi:hypothetical protein